MRRLSQPLLSWVAFIAAVLAFSRVWEAVRGAWEGRPEVPPLAFLSAVVVLLVSLAYLAFTLYRTDRAAGKVRRPIRLFERLIEGGSPTDPPTAPTRDERR